MAQLNKIMLIGRLTRDPEVRTFANGGKVASFGFAINNRKKNPQTGEYEDEPCFLDVKAFNRETGRKLADLVEQYLHKGHQAFIEGHLVMEKWQDKNTSENRSKLVVVLDDVQFLEPKADGQGQGAQQRAAAPAKQRGMQGAKPAPAHYEEPEDKFGPPGDEDNIPF